MKVAGDKGHPTFAQLWFRSGRSAEEPMGLLPLVVELRMMISLRFLQCLPELLIKQTASLEQ